MALRHFTSSPSAWQNRTRRSAGLHAPKPRDLSWRGESWHRTCLPRLGKISVGCRFGVKGCRGLLRSTTMIYQSRTSIRGPCGALRIGARRLARLLEGESLLRSTYLLIDSSLLFLWLAAFQRVSAFFFSPWTPQFLLTLTVSFPPMAWL